MGREQAARVTWGLLVLWIGLMLLLREPLGVAPLGVGAILLASGALHRARGWPFAICLWALGVILIAIGVGDMLPRPREVPWVPVILIALGVYLLYRAFNPRRA